MFAPFVHRRARRLTTRDDRHSYLTEQLGMCFGARARPHPGWRLVRLVISATLATRAQDLIAQRWGQRSRPGGIVLDRVPGVLPLRASVRLGAGRATGSQGPEAGAVALGGFVANQVNATWELAAGTTGRGGNVGQALWELRDGTRPPTIRFGVGATYACRVPAACRLG